VIGLYILLLLTGLAATHRRLRPPYEWWQLSHRLFAPLILIAAVVHIFMVHGFTSTLPMQVLWIVYVSGFLGIAIYHRTYMPLRIWQRPWSVVRNVQELGEARNAGARTRRPQWRFI
jgi:predicted ferric reductase